VSPCKISLLVSFSALPSAHSTRKTSYVRFMIRYLHLYLIYSVSTPFNTN
jgi:hypothetical protein